MKKSQIFGFLLTLLFGPLGLFYSSLPAAIGLSTVAIILGAFTHGLVALITWPICIIVGFFTVWSHNAKVELEEKRHHEILAATESQKIEPRI